MAASRKNKTTKSNGKGKSSRLKKFFFSLIVGLILSIVLCCVFLLSFKSGYPVPELTFRDYVFYSKFVSSQMKNIYNSPPDNREIMLFSPDDVNSLLRLGMNRDRLEAIMPSMPADAAAPNGQKNLDQVNYTTTYDKGRFFFSYLHPLWKNGPSLEISGSATPEYTDGKLHFNLKSVYVGRVPLPAGVISPRLDKWLENELNSDKSYQIYLRTLDKFHVRPDSGELEMIYYPGRVKDLL